MAGKQHQFIIGLINRKIHEYGYTIAFVDGHVSGAFDKKFKLPPKIIRHRPDVIGINDNGFICIGEAKTKDDIFNNRTKAEFFDFSNYMFNGQKCKLIIGIPKSAKGDLYKVLSELGIQNYENIENLLIPDEIIND
jgi:prepilin-type processing-associated H-X9-DG protein